MELKLEERYSKIWNDYDKYLVIPVILFIFSISVLLGNYLLTGNILELGTDFTGGTEITYSIEGEFNTADIEQVFEDAGYSEATVLTETGADGEETLVIVRIPPPVIDQQEEALRILTDAGYNAQVESLSSISAAVSEEFFLQAQLAFIMGFTIMSLVIFIAFKDITPSVAVILAAGGDILFAMAGMAIFNIPLTLGSLAALLMLIGYSVDTDIVLSTRMLKERRGSLETRAWKAIKTGVTMSSGGIAAFTLLYIVSTAIVGPSELSNIAAVMIIGLLADMPFTYFGNAVILKKYIQGELEKLGEIGEKLTSWK